MIPALPLFVDRALREWDFIAYFAYNGFEASGRGVVGLMEDNSGLSVMYGDCGYFEKLSDRRVLQMLDDYDPEEEFLIHFDAPGGTRTTRVRTPADGRSPKRVWFFEMLRRVSEEPDTLPDALPEWFLAACQSLTQEAEQDSGGNGGQRP